MGSHPRLEKQGEEEGGYGESRANVFQFLEIRPSWIRKGLRPRTLP
jgi:hypothetical protein